MPTGKTATAITVRSCAPRLSPRRSITRSDAPWPMSVRHSSLNPSRRTNLSLRTRSIGSRDPSARPALARRFVAHSRARGPLASSDAAEKGRSRSIHRHRGPCGRRRCEGDRSHSARRYRRARYSGAPGISGCTAEGLFRCPAARHRGRERGYVARISSAIVATGASLHRFLALDDLHNALAGFFAAHVVSPRPVRPARGLR